MNTLDAVLYVFVGLAIVLSVVNFSLIGSRTAKVNEVVALTEQENAPPKLELVKIAASSCRDCFEIDPVIENLKKANVNVTSERTLDFSSAEAKELVEKYDIEKLPTVIVLGEVNKSSAVSLWNENWDVEMKDGTQVSSVYAAISPPYLDADGNIKGMVSLTHIVDASCPRCTNLTQLITFLKQNSVVFESEKTVDYNSSEAKGLVSKFGIQRIPAVVVSKDILDYPAILEVWGQLNTVEKEGFYALHTVAPPYKNLTTNTVEGLVSVIYLNDTSCATCYNMQVNKIILERNFGLILVNETAIDVSSNSGKALVNKYNITKVPVILVSPEASAYTGFVSVWPQVGDVASDKWYVMRNPRVLGTYKDLSTGQIISPQPRQQQSGG